MVLFGWVVHILVEDSRLSIDFWVEEKLGSQISVFNMENFMPVYMFRE